MPERRQRGVLAIVFALMLVGLLALIGLALDLAQLYNRKTELQNLADSVALAAARALDGSAAGIDAALAQAGVAAASRKYAYSASVVWNQAAITFGTAPDATGWLDGDSAKAAPTNLLYVKVDTAQLSASHGRVDTSFIRVLSSELASVTTNGRAVAGPTTIRITPLGICAQSSQPAAGRASGAGMELVEYGFRRGVGYNLRNLSSAGAVPLNFLLDPINPAGGGNFSMAAVAPFVCNGSMAVTSLPPVVKVVSPFPAALSDQLNARFNLNLATPPCNASAAPPDTNVKQYLPAGPLWWLLNTPPIQQTALSASSPGGALVTVADLPPPSQPAQAGQYGVLWSYAMAVQFASQPGGGHAPFAKADWPQLYPAGAGAQQASGYPAAPNTPYTNNYASGAYFIGPGAGSKGQRERRVLNIALLACPDPAGANASATVLAIGKFFMTRPATPTAISAEFAGVVLPQALGGAVRLYQ